MTLGQDIRTPAGFLEILRNGSPASIVQAVSNLTDADRRKLSKTAQEYAKSLKKEEREATMLGGVTPGELLRRFQNGPNETNVRIAAAHLGLLAVAPKSAGVVPMRNVRKRGDASSTTEPTEHESAAISILLDRRPEWAQAWLERQFQPADFSVFLTWPSIRRLLDDGLCVPPDTPEFATAMYWIIRWTDLSSEAELFPFVWLFFRHSTGFLRCEGKFRKLESPNDLQLHPGGVEWLWSHVNVGHVDRDRVIDESLAAFWRDFNKSELSALSKLLEALDLSLKEFVDHQQEFLRLLAHETSSVVTFALKCLKAMRKADELDVDAVIAELPQVFSLTTKTQPRSALVLLKTLVGQDASRIGSAVPVAIQALQHEELDVQEAAIRLLEQWATTTVPAEQMRACLDHVFPAVGKRMTALMKSVGAEHDDASSGSSVGDDVSVSDWSQELFAQVRACQPEQRAAWALDESLTAACAGRMLPEISVDDAPFDWSNLESVVPIDSVGELIDQINALIEGFDSAMQIERILDGICRIGPNYPDDFDVRVAPLLKRTERESDNTWWMTASFTFPATLKFIDDWLSGGLRGSSPRRSRDTGWGGHQKSNIARALDLRAKELRKLSGSFPMLSMPTHEHGWITSVALVERLKHYSGHEFSPADFRFALLRLVPGAKFNESELEELPNIAQRLLRYVAGAEPDVHAADDSSLWLAAARSRFPRATITGLTGLKIPQVAWGLQAAKIEVMPENSPPAVSFHAKERQRETERRKKDGRVRPIVHQFVQTTSQVLSMAFASGPQGSGVSLVSIEPKSAGKNPEFPTTVFSSRAGAVRRWVTGQLPDWGEEWLATHWPGNTDSSLALSMVFLFCRLDSHTSSWEPVAPSLRSALWPERAWSRTAVQALWLALFSKDGDARAVAKDALIEGILDGRAHPDQLAPVLNEFLRNRWLKLNRLGEALAEVVRVSAWAALVVSVVLDRVIAAWEEVPRDAHHLLAVQLEALIQVDGCLTGASKMRLESINRSSKTGRIAEQLRTLPGSCASTGQKAALLEGVEGRLRRAVNVQPKPDDLNDGEPDGPG